MKPILNANAILRALWAAPTRAKVALTSVVGAFSARGAAGLHTKIGSSAPSGRLILSRSESTSAKTTDVRGRDLFLGSTTRFKLAGSTQAARDWLLGQSTAAKRFASQAGARFSFRSSSTGQPASVNQAPVWQTVPTITFTQGTAANISIAGFVSDPNGDPLTITKNAQALPAGVTYNAAQRRFEYNGTAPIAGTDGHVLTADDGISDTADVTSFALTSTSTQAAAPFMLGHAFRKGDVGSTDVLSTSEPNSRVVVKRRWNDGSVKHAIIVGRTALTANTAKTITVRKGGTAPGGTALTSADIQAAAPSASVQCGAIGTVNLSSLLASPFRTWVSTPEMVECHYRAVVTGELVVWFHVRLWAGGRVWVRAVIENGTLTTLTPTTRSYTATVIVGGVTVYTGSITQYKTRWTAEGWIGGNPAVTPTHSVTYAISTRLIPNYWKRNPSAAALNALTQSYSPLQLTPHETVPDSGGWHDHVGPQPLWASLYCTSADARAYRAMLTGSTAFNSYNICQRSPVNAGRLPRFSDHAAYAIEGGTDTISNAANRWERSHVANEGYAAYLFTGDYFHYETMGLNVACQYFVDNGGVTQGGYRVVRTQNRGVAEWVRNAGLFCAVAPTEGADTADLAVITDYQGALNAQITWYRSQVDQPNQNQLGIPYLFSSGAWGPNAIGNDDGTAGPWMTHYWVAYMGWISDAEPVSDLTNLNYVRDYMYKWPVGLMGATDYCYTRGFRYGVRVTSTTGTQFGVDTRTTAGFYNTFAQVWAGTIGGAFSCPVPANIQDITANQVARSNPFGGALIAIAYAAEHGAAGASAAWTRVSGASNWSAIETGTTYPDNFNDTPIFGIVPRGFGGT